MKAPLIQLPSAENIRLGTMAGKGPRTVEYIRKILPHGFESFQLNVFKPETVPAWAQLATEFEPVLADTGTVVSSLGVYANPLGNLAEDEVARQSWETAIRHAADFGTDLVCGFTGRVRDESIEDSLPRYKEVFGELGQLAADHGVRLAFENCPMGGDWRRGDFNIAHNPAAWELMFDALPRDNIGLEWEPCHQICQGIDPLPQLREWLPKVFHVHGKDANFYPDIVARYGYHSKYPKAHHRHPGFGDTDWKLIIGELRRGGFQGAIDIEGWHDPIYRGDWEMTGQVAALKYLKDCRTSYVPNPEGF